MEPQNFLIQNESEHPLTYGELQNRINAIYKLMPMETKSFVSCIEEKIKGEDLSKIYIKGKKFSVKTQEEKVLLTMLFYLRDIDAQLHILNCINTAEFNNKKKLNYDKNFYMCEKLSDYTTLTPHSLVLKYMNSLRYDKLNLIFKKFFKIYVDDFIENLIAKNKIFEQILRNRIKKEYFENMDESTIKYYKKIGQCLNKIIDEKSYQYNQNILRIECLFFCKHDLCNKLKSIGLTIEKIKEYHRRKGLNIISESDLYFEYQTEIKLLKTYIPVHKPKIEQELLYLLDNDESFNKLLIELEVDIEFFRAILDYQHYKNKNEDDFYELPYNIQKFLTTGTMIYNYLMENYNSLDKLIIKDKNDLLPLALLISSYHQKLTISEYFKTNNIFLERLEILFNLNLEKNMFENPNNNILPEYYKALETFINKEQLDVKKFEIEVLTTKNFFNSRVLYRIFEYSTKRKLNNFYSTIERFNNQAQERILYGLDKDVKNYLKGVINLYLHIKGEFDDETKEVISILLQTEELDEYKNGLLKKYICGNLSINTGMMKTIFNFKYDNDHSSEFINFENRIKKYIYEGINKEKRPYEITIESIIENIFSKELFKKYKTSPIEYILKKLNINKENLQNLEEKVEIERIKDQKEKINNYIINLKENGLYQIFLKALKIYNLLENKNIGVALFIAYMQNSKYEQELKNIGIEIDELKKIYSIDSINTEADFNILHEYNNEYYGYLYTKENTNVEEFILDVIWKTKTTLEMKINKEILNNTIKFLENVETYEKQKQLEKFSKQYNELEIISYDLPKLLNSDEYLTEHLNNICKEIKLATEKEEIIDYYYIKKIEEELKYKDAYLTFIEEVPEKIEKSIPKIKEQIKLYTYIISYIETYIEKNKQYQESANKALSKIKLSVEHENAKQILNMKIKNSKEIESIMKVELLKTYKKQLFHIDNINKLNIYKLILDLLGEEINNNIEVINETDTLLKIINSIIKENITDIETNMKKLKRKNLSEEIIKKLESEIKEYKKRR